MNGCIIIGYQGIGKSSTVKETRNTTNHVIDLESSCWKNSDGYRSDNQYVSYCNIALDLAKQGNTVFTASHKVVRDYLLKNKEDVEIIVIFPSIKLKDKWIDRLENRYINTNLDKDMFALLNAKDMYEENIHDLENYSSKIDLGIKIINTNYNLLEILREYNIVD